MLTARFVEAVITASLLSPLVILAWKYPRVYRIVAIGLLAATTLFFVLYQAYYQGAHTMYLKAMEASDYYQIRSRPLGERMPLPSPDSLMDISQLSGRLQVVEMDSIFTARRGTVEFWIEALLPGRIESAYRHVAPLDRYYVLFTWVTLCSMLWAFTYIHRLKTRRMAT
jgi:hypothetical protein